MLTAVRPEKAPCGLMRAQFASVAHGLFAHGCSRVHVVYRHARIRRGLMGVFPYLLPRRILYEIYPQIASRIPNKREILQLSQKIVRATRHSSVREIEQNCTFIFTKADYYCS